jgi:tRNA-modifying protein YgfZ
MIHEQWQSYLSASSLDPPSARQPVPPSGIAYLPDLAVVRFAGADARKFLQGYLTCDTDLLTDGVLTPAALCNLKGRVVMNGWCAPAGQDVLLVLHRSLVDDLAAFLRAYLMFSKTTLVRPEVLVIGALDLWQPAPAGDSFGDRPGETDPTARPQPQFTVDARRRLFFYDDLADAQALWEALPHLSAEVWLAALTADGIPLVSQPVSQMFLPQMLNLEALGAIDFTKGCYLGQEVVARAQHRGQVKRRLARLTWSGTEAPAAGAEVIDGRQRTVGVVVQSATDAHHAGPLLAVLQQEATPPLLHGATRLEQVD